MSDVCCWIHVGIGVAVSAANARESPDGVVVEKPRDLPTMYMTSIRIQSRTGSTMRNRLKARAVLGVTHVNIVSVLAVLGNPGFGIDPYVDNPMLDVRDRRSWYNKSALVEARIGRHYVDTTMARPQSMYLYTVAVRNTGAAAPGAEAEADRKSRCTTSVMVHVGATAGKRKIRSRR